MAMPVLSSLSVQQRIRKGLEKEKPHMFSTYLQARAAAPVGGWLSRLFPSDRLGWPHPIRGGLIQR